MTRAARWALLVAWIAALAALAAYVQANLSIGTDLRSFMPPARTPEQKLLLDEIGEGPGSRLLLVAVSGAAQDDLAAISKRLAQALHADERFLRVLNGDTDLAAIAQDLLPYRYLLSPTLDTQTFDATTLRSALEERLEDLGSPAAGWLKPLLARDPTLETLKLAEAWAPPQEPQRYGDVWFDAAGKTALLLVETSAPGFDPEAQRGAQAALRAHFDDAAKGTTAQIEISGPGAFAVRINDTTSAEANRIGLVDSVSFFLLLLFAYRRLRTVLLGALPLLTGGLVGTAALAAAFGGAHGITLAFGFTLIGVAQDYPIHLFSHLHGGQQPRAVARALWPTLSTGIAGTSIAYLAFFASGVDGLRQLALFTIVGLASAGLATRFLLPRLIAGTPRDAGDSALLGRAWAWLEGLPRPHWLPLVLFAGALAVLLARSDGFWQNDLAALTPVPESLLRRDAELRSALGAPDVRYLVVVEDADVEGVLRRSEALAPVLETLRTNGALAAYNLPSRYLPSAATQRARQARLPDPETLRSALAAARRDLPFRIDFAPFLADVEAARTLAPLDLERAAATPLGLRVKAMLAPREGRTLALVPVGGIADPGALQAALAPAGARLLDLKAASESLVADYRGRVLWSLAISALLLVGVVAVALKRTDRVLRVLVPMALSTLLILAALRGFGVALTLFHLVALILAAGLGLDYALFFEHVEDAPAEQRRTLHALLVCSASTFLVFALLALSSLPVLRAIGVTVTLGVVFNFVLAVLITRRRAHRG